MRGQWRQKGGTAASSAWCGPSPRASNMGLQGNRRQPPRQRLAPPPVLRHPGEGRLVVFAPEDWPARTLVKAVTRPSKSILSSWSRQCVTCGELLGRPVTVPNRARQRVKSGEPLPITSAAPASASRHRNEAFALTGPRRGGKPASTIRSRGGLSLPPQFSRVCLTHTVHWFWTQNGGARVMTADPARPRPLRPGPITRRYFFDRPQRPGASA